MSHLKKFREKNKHPATLEPPCGRLEHTCKATGLQRDLRLLASWKRKFVEKVVGWRCNQNRCSGSKSAKFEVCVHLATASTVCRHMGHLLVVWKLPILHLHTGHGENGAVGRATLGGSSFIQLACAEYAGKPADFTEQCCIDREIQWLILAQTSPAYKFNCYVVHTPVKFTQVNILLLLL